jgi:uncharacterized repeat protein (TIGR02543 family)
MRKIKLFLSLLMLFAFSLGNVWAATAEFSYSDLSGQGTSGSGADFTGATKGDVFMSGKGNGNTSYVQIYANGTLTFTPLNGATITKIVLEATTSGYVKTWSSSPEGVSVSDKYVTWEGSSTSVVTLTNTASGQARIKKMTVTYTEGSGTPTCATPTFSPAAGSYEGTQNVTISSTAGATIYYTTDGSTPSTSSSVYSSPIAVSADMTIKAYAVKADYDDSEVATAAYTITEGPDVTIDLLDEGWGFPTSKVINETSYTNGSYTIKVAGTSGNGFRTYGTYFLLGQSGAYIELPVFTSPIAKIVVAGNSNGSGTVAWNIYQGENAVSIAASGCKNDAYTFEIAAANQKANVAHTIKVTSAANLQIKNIKIYFGEAAAVDAPTISGETSFVGSTEVTITAEGADAIYYTLDGTDPTTSSTKYTEGFTLDATKTVKAIAVKGSDVSAVAEKTFTKVEALESLAALLDATTSTETAFNVVISDWVVTGVSGSRAWIADAANEKGILLYKSGHNFVAGNKLNGVVLGTKTKLYQGYPELTTLLSSDVTVTAAEAITPRTTTIAALTSGYNKEQGTVVKLENLTYTASTTSFSDGANTIKLNTQLYNPAMVDGAEYTIIGIVRYDDNAAISIMPRSVDDVEQTGEASLPEVTGLAALKAEATGSSYLLNLTDAVVTLVDGNNAFIEDATAGALIYYNGHELAAGDKLNGKYEVTTATYQGKFEITAMTAQEGANKVADAEIPVTTLTIAELDANFAANESKRIKIVGVDVTDAIGNNDRNGQISDGTNTFALYAGKNGIAAAENDNVDIIGYPTFYNDAHQFNVWAQTDITVNEKVTVRFFAPSSWENVYVNTWDGTDNGQHAMTAVGEGNWYQCKIEKGAPFLFYNGSWNGTNQTVDIAALTEDKCFMGTLPETEGGKISVAEVANCAATYFIAGSEALTGQDWQHIALNEGNTITFNNVAAGDHQFKITNGTWYWSIGLANASATGVTLWNGGDNVGFTTTAAMNITITYNPATNTITVAAEAVPDNVEWSTVKFKAAGSDFAIKENVPQGQPYTIDLAETPWRPGYNFAGWSASEIASASEFTTPLTTITPDADEVTLYAVFSKEITPGSANYVKVTATEDITDGQYLIVYEDENVAFNGGLETLDASGNTIGVEIEEDKIASNTTTDAAAFTIDVTNGTVKSASNFYIGVTSYGNGLKQNASADTYSAHSFSINGDGNAIISLNDNWTDNMILNYNSNTNDKRFRYYKGGNQKAIQLYKKVATPGTYSYTTDPATIYHIAGTPALTGEGTAEAWAHKALGEGNTITFDNVEAGEYKFKITDGTWDWSKGDAAVDKTNSSGVTFSETDGDGNVVFSVASETSVTITYDAANDKILVVAPIVRNYHIAGSEALTGQDWQHIALNEGNSITFNNVAAGDYEFKITDGTWDWYVSYAAENVDSENSNVTISESESNSNFKFTLAAKSNVTIAYNEETGKVTVNAEAIPEPKNVVVLAEYNSKFYAMTNSLASGALAAVEVEKDNDKIVVFAEADKDAIQWTATTDGNNNTTLKDANDKYIKGSSGASLSLDEAAYNWNWDSEESCYISSEYTNRGLFFNNSGVFKGYATSNLANDAYAATEVIEIAAENIILSTKVDPQLAFNPEEVTLTVGDEFVAPVLGYVGGFDGLDDVTLESSNTSLAVVNEGVVSLVENATGTATITATFAGNSNYLAGTASYTITVNEVGDDLSGSWVLATTVPAVGQKVIIAATYQNETKAMGIQNSNNRAAVVSTLEDDVLTPGAGTKVFTLVDAGDGKFAIQASNGNYLSAAGTGTSNYLKEAENFDEDNAKWTITIENGEANIVASSNNRNVLRYNSGNTIFSCYQSGAQRAINIYVQDTYTRPLEPNRYYTVCLPKKMMEVRGASFWTLSSRNTAETEAYLEEVDPTTAEAGTPFIIQATDTKLEVVYTGAATTTAGTNGALHGTLTYMSAADLAAAGSNIYMLYNNALRPVGTNNHLDANRAYINYNELNPVTEAPQPAPGRRVRAVPMQQNTATGIDELNGSEAPAKVLINGQLFILRGEKMYDAKGLLVK